METSLKDREKSHIALNKNSTSQETKFEIAYIRHF